MSVIHCPYCGGAVPGFCTCGPVDPEAAAETELGYLYESIPELIDAVEASLRISDPSASSVRILREVRALRSRTKRYNAMVRDDMDPESSARPLRY